MRTIEFLENAFWDYLADVDSLIESPPAGEVCAMMGTLIEGVGCRLKKVVSVASADIADTFRYRSEWLSEDVARLYKSSRVLRGNLLALPGRGVRPFVSSESATEARPCWRDLIFSSPVGTQTVAIFTNESKRRLWPSATLSIFGSLWRPFFNGPPYKGGVAQGRSLAVDVWKLRECLALVERVYSAGFSKRLIEGGLIGVSARKQIDKIGLEPVRRLEGEVAPWRGSDEFLLSLFVAQKQGEMDGKPK